jgi:hypothetical protein
MLERVIKTPALQVAPSYEPKKKQANPNLKSKHQPKKNPSATL